MRKFLFIFLLLAACSSPHADKYNTGETEEEVISLFNEHEYAKAVWLIENRHGRQPEDPNICFLLGEAYLGKAGIEPLVFAAKVTGAQQENVGIFPNCSNEKIRSFKETDIKCVLKRVYIVAPDADSKDFKRARELFRIAYPNPSQSPMWVNTIIGMVETISVVNRAGSLYMYARGLQNKGEKLKFSDLDIPWLVRQGQLSIDEADQAIKRAQYSSDKVSKLLGGSAENIWFERTKDGVEFAKAVGLSGLVEFIRNNISSSDDLRYGQMLSALQALLESYEK